MSVVCETNEGMVLDSWKYFETCYKNTNNDCCEKHGNSLAIPKASLYNVESQFKMNTEHEAEVREAVADISETLLAKRRKRRRRKTVQCAERDEVSNKIEVMFNSMMLSACAAGLFDHMNSSSDNNIAARSSVESLGCGSLLLELTALSSLGLERCVGFCQLNNQQDASSCKEPLFHNVIQSTCNECLTVRLQGRGFLIPPRSRFLMSDIPGLLTFSQTCDDKFDFIVIDPPWDNKSARRKKVYKMMTNHDLLDLPIKSLSADNTLLAIWCTNRKSQHEFVESNLLSHWDFKVISTWYWCKITRSGEPIHPFGGSGKKPYETLYIAVRTNQTVPNHLIASRVLVSVPSLQHSAKPPLLDLLKKYLPKSPRCLELFARNLLPNFTSWGNEVLLHQDLDFFV